MRNFQSLFLIIMLLFCSVDVSAQDFNVEGIMYRVTSEHPATAMVYKGHRCFSQMQIPAEVQYQEKSYDVTQIEYDAFSYLNCLFVLDLGGVEQINDGYVEVYEDGAKNYHGAFSNCGALKEIDFRNVRYLGDYAFHECQELKDLDLPDVERIGKGCFSACEGLRLVELGTKILKIEKEAFGDVDGLERVVTHAVEPPLCEENAFSDVAYQRALLQVPQGAKSVYETAAGWRNFSTIEEMPSTGIDKVTAMHVGFVNGMLRIEGIHDGELVQIFDVNGVLISEITGDGHFVHVKTLPGKVGIVKIGHQMFKVIGK